jgi:DnaK suppressor protein
MSKKENVLLPMGYVPSEEEEYMCSMHVEYFRQKLLNWRTELQNESQETLLHLKEESWNEPDLSDRASLEVDVNFELRAKDRARKLIEKIDAALERLEKGTYGYCEDTGEKIGLKRLDARPIATLSIEAQERHERFETTHNEIISKIKSSNAL